MKHDVEKNKISKRKKQMANEWEESKGEDSRMMNEKKEIHRTDI